MVVAGGQENMTLAPHATQLRGGVKLGSATLIDTMMHDGLTDSFLNVPMGITAENVANKYNITRAEQDAFAAKSQQLAEVACNNGYFDNEIVPVVIPGRGGDTVFNKDEFPKSGTTTESLGKLGSCFIKDGTVTPGNASGINDSAAAVLLMSESEVKTRNVQPLAKIIAFAQGGCEPDIMGVGSVPAVQTVVSICRYKTVNIKSIYCSSFFFQQLKKAGWNIDDVDLYELNEAFAAVSVAVNNELGVDATKVNIHGGAIALGHPIGASGARVLVTLIYALKRTGGKKGVAALCIGGGMGIAIAIELQ